MCVRIVLVMPCGTVLMVTLSIRDVMMIKRKLAARVLNLGKPRCVRSNVVVRRKLRLLSVKMRLVTNVRLFGILVLCRILKCRVVTRRNIRWIIRRWYRLLILMFRFRVLMVNLIVKFRSF